MVQVATIEDMLRENRLRCLGKFNISLHKALFEVITLT